MTSFLLLQLSCAAHRPLETPKAADLDSIVAGAVHRELPSGVLQARFRIQLDSENVNGTTNGAFVMHPPDDLRFDIYTPLHTPLLFAATDGTALHAYAAKGNRFFRGDDAVHTLEALLGGALVVEDLLDILTGIPPVRRATLQTVEAIPGGARAIYTGTMGTEISIDIDAKGGAMRHLEARQGTDTLLVTTYDGSLQVGSQVYPEDIRLEVSRAGIKVRLEILEVHELSEVPDVFLLKAPPGSTELDLLTELQKMRPAAGP